MGVALSTAVLAGIVWFALLGFVVTLILTALTLAYARNHGLLDMPGKRRSHHVPTPRGGGIGIVAAALLVGLPAWSTLDRAVSPWTLAAVGVAVAAVALVGWRDDHSPLPVLPRIAVHIGAAILVGVVVLAPWARGNPVVWAGLIVLVPLLVGFINAHNFMDGIDGILALQATFVLLGYGLLALITHPVGLSALAFTTAAACIGFLAFNHPPAKIFMGDVGSGSVGLLLGAVGALLVSYRLDLFWSCVILPSAFLVDSGLTLAHRVLSGQRWYAPHRQHLYQWLVRIKWSHGRTDVAYVIWNLAVIAPLAWLAAYRPHWGVACAALTYAASIGVWYAGKRACLAAACRSKLHEAA